MAIVRIVDMAQLVRPRGMAAAGLIHTTTDIRAFVAPLAGIITRGVYGARVYRGRGYAYRGYRGGYRGGVYRGRAVAVRGGYGRASPAAEDRQRLISNASFEPLPSAMEFRQGPRSTSA